MRGAGARLRRELLAAVRRSATLVPAMSAMPLPSAAGISARPVVSWAAPNLSCVSASRRAVGPATARGAAPAAVSAAVLGPRLVRDGRAARASFSTAAADVDDGVPVLVPEAGDEAAPAFEVAIDWEALAADVEGYEADCKARSSDGDPRRVLALRTAHLEAVHAVEALRAERNALSKRGKSKGKGKGAKGGKGSKAEPEADAAPTLTPEELAARGRELRARLTEAEAVERSRRAELQAAARALPNRTHPDAPTEAEGERVRARVGPEPLDSARAGFALRDHVEIAQSLGLADWETAGRSSGSRFVYLAREAALLETALVSYALDRATQAGFVATAPPDLVRSDLLERCGFRPRGESSQIYSVRGSPLALTGTAEVPLAGVFADRLLPASALPARLCGVGHAFRTEAGAPGAATRGLYRLHQFTKVELFVACEPHASDAVLEELIAFELAAFGDLGLTLRAIDMPPSDLGAPAARKVDVEAWMPGLERWGELSSASTCTDYQARRLNARYRPDEAHAEGGPRTRFVHTLNATAAAIPRIIVALLETHQREDGGVDIPEALWPYSFGIREIKPRQGPGAAILPFIR